MIALKVRFSLNITSSSKTNKYQPNIGGKMKKIILVGLTLTSITAMARTKTVVPHMLLENGFEFQSTKVTDICVNADGTFETIAAKKCVEYRKHYNSRFDRFEDKRACKKYGSLKLFANTTKTTGNCVEWGRVNGENGECTRIEYTTSLRPLSYEIKTHQLVRNDGDWDLGKVLSSELFTIPACN